MQVMPRVGDIGQARTEQPESKLAVASQVKLGFARTYYTMAQALGLQKLQDLVLVICNLEMSSLKLC